MKSFSSIIAFAFVVAAIASPVPQLNGLPVGNVPETATGAVVRLTRLTRLPLAVA